MAQKAIDLARPGDIILIDAGGFAEQAEVGEITASHAIARNVDGFVIGRIHDIDFIAAGQLAVYAAGSIQGKVQRDQRADIHWRYGGSTLVTSWWAMPHGVIAVALCTWRTVGDRI